MRMGGPHQIHAHEDRYKYAQGGSSLDFFSIVMNPCVLQASRWELVQVSLLLFQAMVYLGCCKETQVQFPLHDTGRKDPLVGTFFGCCRVLDERGHNSIPDHTLCKIQ